MSESKFWKEIRRNIGHVGHFSRVESGETSAGIPDVDYCVDGVKGHIELKYGTEDDLPELRPSQSNWIKARLKAGEEAFVFAKIILRGKPKYFLFKGERALKIPRIKTYSEWETTCNYAWFGTMEWPVLVKILKGANPAYV